MLSQINGIIYITTQLMQVLIFMAGCYFFGISIFGWLKRRDDNPLKYPPQKKFALIVAAHNEEKVIAHILDSLFKQNYPSNLYDVFVIADNCNDKTAEIAEELGAKVYKRFNTSARGKGHALEWMFAKIFNMEEKYDAISVFDADNLVTSNFLIEMNKQMCKGHKVVQGYIDSKNPFDSWITCSYSIAFWLSNRIFQLPRYYLGLSCGLCGTGFCIDVDVLKQIGWGATCLTEDLEFTMKLALSDLKVAWAHKAVVYDEKPLTLKQSWNQRKRWMQGHADCAGRFLRPLFSKAFKEGDLISFDGAVYLFQPIRLVFIGLITIMMWIQTIFPESPFFNMKYVFPSEIWHIFVLLQFFYGPLVVLSEKKFNLKVILGFLIYPIYCLTWIPITIQGFLSKNNKDWSHTHHSREISINELEKA
jgi:cellulose synthase/poly-beta-1,6-N-acetylglucosamine synthase-like glycosyltransferase